MLLDTSELPDGHELVADLVIVGAGAAGITIALELIGSGLSVLLLESGGAEEEPATQNLYAGTVVDAHLHSPPDRYRQRRYGGTTSIWGGRCTPFDPIDFDGARLCPRRWLADHARGRANLSIRAPMRCARQASSPIPPKKPSALQPARSFSGFASADFSTDRLERFSLSDEFRDPLRAQTARQRTTYRCSRTPI